MKKIIMTLLLISMLFVTFAGTGYADGLQADSVHGKVGDSITVSYVIPNRVENVGAITLYLNYDSSILRASNISLKKPPITTGDSDISRMAPKEDSSGSIVASWVEVYCSMVLEPGFELFSVTFTFIADAEETEISSAIILKGMASAGSNGNDDLTSLAGVKNAVIKLSTADEPEIEDTESTDEPSDIEDTVVPEDSVDSEDTLEPENTPNVVPETGITGSSGDDAGDDVPAEDPVTPTVDIPEETAPPAETDVLDADEEDPGEEQAPANEIPVSTDVAEEGSDIVQAEGNSNPLIIVLLVCSLIVVVCIAIIILAKKKKQKYN